MAFWYDLRNAVYTSSFVFIFIINKWHLKRRQDVCSFTQFNHCFYCACKIHVTFPHCEYVYRSPTPTHPPPIICIALLIELIFRCLKSDILSADITGSSFLLETVISDVQ